MKKILLTIILLGISLPSFSTDIKAIYTNTSFEEVARIDKLEQIKINEMPRTQYTPTNLRTQYNMSFQGKDKNNTMVWWSNTFTDYDTKILKSEIIDNTYYLYDNSGNIFETGEHVDLSDINNNIDDLTSGLEQINKQVTKNKKNIKQNTENIEANSQAIEENNEAIKQNTKKINKNTKNIKNNTQSIQTINERIEGYAKDIDRIDSKLDTLEQNMYSGLATVTALTSLHPNPRSEGIIELSVGTGIYRDQCAGAVGMFIHPTENLMLQGGASIGNHSYAGFVGLTFSFGSRKER